jgi:hypothetical protein
MNRYSGSQYFHKHPWPGVAYQQRAADHSHTTGQDEAGHGTLSPYLNRHGPQVRVGGKPARPHRPPWRLRSEAKLAPQGNDLVNLL